MEGAENGKLSFAFHRQKTVPCKFGVNLRRRSSTSACRETEYKVEQSLTITEERVERNYEYTLFTGPENGKAGQARGGQQNPALRPMPTGDGPL